MSIQTVSVQGFEQVVIGSPLGGNEGGLWAKIGCRWFRISADRNEVCPNFVVTPSMVAGNALVGRFGRMECEYFAALLIRFAVNGGGWEPFSFDSFNKVCQSPVAQENLEFFTELGFLTFKSGLYHFTKGFVQVVM